MKKFNYLFFLCAFIATFTACQDDGGDTPPEPDYAAPTITITAPDLGADNELTPTVGETITFTLSVAAEAGLSEVSMNGTTLKTYMAGDTEDEISVDYTVANEEVAELVFTVEDAEQETASTNTITISPVPAEDPNYVLLDLGGQSTGEEAKTVVDWDQRTVYAFEVATPHTTSATAEVAASQAQLSFAQPNPEGSGNTLQIVKQPMEGFDNWGGWVNVIFNLNNPIPQEEVLALPQYDMEANELTPGTKVIKVDVYYDDTVDPDYSWEDVIAATDVWNADPSQGYKIDLTLANYEEHANTESGYDNNGYYISYSAYIPEPNTWVTLTFDMADEGRAGNFYSVEATEVDAINLKPAPGYSGDDQNPLYVKNLRIEDVEE
jgi:hypothetical protein